MPRYRAVVQIGSRDATIADKNLKSICYSHRAFLRRLWAALHTRGVFRGNGFGTKVQPCQNRRFPTCRHCSCGSRWLQTTSVRVAPADCCEVMVEEGNGRSPSSEGEQFIPLSDAGEAILSLRAAASTSMFPARAACVVASLIAVAGPLTPSHAALTDPPWPPPPRCDIVIAGGSTASLAAAITAAEAAPELQVCLTEPTDW